MEIRTIQTTDLDGLMVFFARVPEGDRTFFKEDVSDARLVESWLQDGRSRRVVAVEGDRIIGYLAVIPGVGWSRHVGEVRVVVDPDRRGQHVGGQLAYRGLQDALSMNLTKMVVEVVADQPGTIALFQGLGFEAEAILADHVRDGNGKLHDLILLSHRVDDTWGAMVDIGIDKAMES